MPQVRRGWSLFTRWMGQRIPASWLVPLGVEAHGKGFRDAIQGNGLAGECFLSFDVGDKS